MNFNPVNLLMQKVSLSNSFTWLFIAGVISLKNSSIFREKLKKEYGDLREKLTSFPLKLRHEYKVN